MKNHESLRKLSAEVKARRTDISLLLATLTACLFSLQHSTVVTNSLPSCNSEAPNVRIQLNELSAQKAELVESFRQFEESTARQLDSVSNSLGSIQSRLTTSTEAIQALRPINSIHRSPISLQTSISRPNRCRPLCTCFCHERTTRNLPKWLQQVVDSLFIRYFGIP